jgi:hypothetical protein
MSPGSPESREVPVDVLPPLPDDARVSSHSSREGTVAPLSGLATFYHPASGIVILGLDWMIFGTDLATEFLGIPFFCALGFLVTLPVVYAIQRRWRKDSRGLAFAKAAAGAILVAIPFPVTGTLLGAGILALSGLSMHPIDMLRKLMSPTPKLPQ